MLDSLRVCLVQDFEEYLWLGSLLETFYLMRHERQSKVNRADRSQLSSGIGLAEVSKARMCPCLLNTLM